MSGLRVIACERFLRTGRSQLHDLARAARGGDPAALDAVAAIMSAGAAREAPALGSAIGVTVVPMAGHHAGSFSGPAPELARRLCAAQPAWRAAVGPERLADAPHALHTDARDPAAEAATIGWRDVPGDGPILLVDDVVRTGASLAAAWLAAPPGIRERLVALVAFRAEG